MSGSGIRVKLFPPIFTRPPFRNVDIIRELSAVSSRPSFFVHFSTFGDLKHGSFISINKIMPIINKSIRSKHLRPKPMPKSGG